MSSPPGGATAAPSPPPDPPSDKAPLPPRKNPTPTRISRQHLTPLQTLLQLGFPRARAERALVATGDRGVQLASDWLLAHVNDPDLDREDLRRSYVACLCPASGALREQLQTFFDASLTQVGWNGAHNASPPHVRLTSPFPCADASVPALRRAMDKVAADFAQDFREEPLKLERFSAPNFLGLVLGKREEILLRSLCQALTEEAGTAAGVRLEPISKSYHLPLAFQFQPQHLAGLQDLFASVDPSSPCDWELRLYSSEERAQGKDVLRVVHAHEPREEDELELRIGDLVYVAPEEIKSSQDGWVLGTSWLTGSQGYLPKNHVRQAAETSAWTLHQSIPMTAAKAEEGQQKTSPQGRLEAGSSLLSLGSQGGEGSPPHPRPAAEEDVEPPTQVKASKSSTSLASSSSIPAPGAPRKVFICRHGERVDFTFGAWIPYCVDESGRYTQRDLNMPASLPRRSNWPDAYLRDSPLTSVGIVQARLLGEAMLAAGATVSHAFSSPSFRCVQTCHHILVGLGAHRDVQISLEPGLFEWLAWHQNSIPDSMTPDELREAGYNVDPKYKPYISADELRDTEETCEEYYTRNYFVSQCVLQAKEGSGGNVLFVGHAATLDACVRQLTGNPPRPAAEMMAMLRKVPYCSLASIEETRPPPATPSKSDKHHQQQHVQHKQQWNVIEPPVPPMTHTSNARFDWKILLTGPSQNSAKN